jgi:hypothetical protein
MSGVPELQPWISFVSAWTQLETDIEIETEETARASLFLGGRSDLVSCKVLFTILHRFQTLHFCCTECTKFHENLWTGVWNVSIWIWNRRQRTNSVLKNKTEPTSFFQVALWVAFYATTRSPQLLEVTGTKKGHRLSLCKVQGFMNLFPVYASRRSKWEVEVKLHTSWSLTRRSEWSTSASGNLIWMEPTRCRLESNTTPCILKPQNTETN